MKKQDAFTLENGRDGVLDKESTTSTDAHCIFVAQRGFPIIITQGVWDRYVAVSGSVTGRDEERRLGDLLQLVAQGIAESEELNARRKREELIHGPHPSDVELVLAFYPTDRGEDVILVKLPATR